MAKLADALDSKSSDPYGLCGFDSHLRHHRFNDLRGLRNTVLDQFEWRAAHQVVAASVTIIPGPMRGSGSCRCQGLYYERLMVDSGFLGYPEKKL